MKIKWISSQYGGNKSADLGHNFKLWAVFPLTTTDKYVGYVNSKKIGDFETQEECMNQCEKIAIQIIKELYKEYGN